jgi:Rad3-related DNA helicase
VQHPIKFFEEHNIKARPQQLDVIENLHKKWDDYKYFALSLPTGVGKTYIATAIADSCKNAYVLTSNLQLQDQYIKSWDKLINLKGRGNYTCNLNPNFTVDSAPCSANSSLLRVCINEGTCAYYTQKKIALASKAMITNPVYMLYSTHCGFANDDSPWIKREVLIIDEAHNLENHLVSFAESNIDPEKYHADFGVATQAIKFTGRPEEDYFKIIEIQGILMHKATELAAKLEEEFPQAKLVGLDAKQWARGFTEKVGEKVKKLNTKIYQLDKAIQPLKIFFNTHTNPEELAERWIVSKDPEKNVLKLAPIYGDFLFHEYFGKLADKFVFLSATLGTKSQFCKEIGIEDSDCFFIETDSPFDPKKSPVIVMPVIKLSKDSFEQNVKKIGGLIDDILNIHQNQRGIIHCVTYNLQKEIFQRVNKKSQERLLCRDMDELKNANLGNNRFPKRYKNDELLAIHEQTGVKFSSVLLSPSMMEGVDLYDDLSEFQVIIKLPWANLGDVRVNIKSKIDSEWYANRMWLNILQASGRSTRHESDTSITYIFDKNFVYFYDQWKNKLPDWFKLRIVF